MPPSRTHRLKTNLITRESLHEYQSAIESRLHSRAEIGHKGKFRMKAEASSEVMLVGRNMHWGLVGSYHG